MRLITIFLFILTSNVMGQVMVGGEVQGELYATEKVSGNVEVGHIWGRTTIMPVKSAWVNIYGDNISVGAKTDNPVLDGSVRNGYCMPHMSGKLSSDFPQQIQTITKKEILSYSDDIEYYRTSVGIITMKDNKPTSLVFTCTDYAMFDVKKHLAKLSRGITSERREAEELAGFDDLGFRSETFKARF